MSIPKFLSEETSLRQTSCKPSKATTSVVVTI
uniref:Uncharacterized protein n=1 Tax=Lepeophtheirus salmonis TaxID=72036 RepID=A0A0K2VEG1_LEPSM